MKFDKKFLVDMSKFTDLQALKEKGRFRHLFSLETLQIRLWLDSNPGPCAWQSDTLSTTPNFLIQILEKISVETLQEFYSRVASRLEQQSAISSEKPYIVLLTL